jgi:hypothetical protein
MFDAPKLNEGGGAMATAVGPQFFFDVMDFRTLLQAGFRPLARRARTKIISLAEPDQRPASEKHRTGSAKNLDALRPLLEYSVVYANVSTSSRKTLSQLRSAI